MLSSTIIGLVIFTKIIVIIVILVSYFECEICDKYKSREEDF